MKINAIIFDKDGTLLKFDDFWLPISEGAIGEILRKVKREDIPVEKILAALGVKDGVTNINGVLCCGTYKLMGQEIHHVLKEEGCNLSVDEVTELTVQAYRNHMHRGVIKPACNQIQEVLQKLKNLGIRLAVVTTDEPILTKVCLQKLGIERFFDMIYTDDGITPKKPDPYCIDDFCQKKHLLKSEVIMVGDTLTDVRFAKNGGIRVIGVAMNARNQHIMKTEADIVIPDISHLLDWALEESCF